MSCIRWSIDDVLCNAWPKPWWRFIIHIVPPRLECAVESVIVYWMIIGPQSTGGPGSRLSLVEIEFVCLIDGECVVSCRQGWILTLAGAFSVACQHCRILFSPLWRIRGSSKIRKEVSPLSIETDPSVIWMLKLPVSNGDTLQKPDAPKSRASLFEETYRGILIKAAFHDSQRCCAKCSKRLGRSLIGRLSSSEYINGSVFISPTRQY